jgi:hypothetical protein
MSGKTICLHPTIENSILQWFANRTTPAVFLVGPPGVGKTTLAYRVMEQNGMRVSEFNASHTRSGACFRKIILPLLQRGGVINMMETGSSQKGGLGVILDEIDGLSSGEKGGLQSLLAYLREWKPSNPGVPVIFISNTIQQRMLQMISRYCLTFKVTNADEGQVRALIGKDVPNQWKQFALGDLRPLLRGEYNEERYVDDDCPQAIPEGVVPLAKWCLYSEMDPFLILEMENNDSNLAGLVIAENIPDRLECVKGDTREAWDLYIKMFRCIQESDYADYWAFFYQTWRLLGLSQDVKINTMNLFLNKYAPYHGSLAEKNNGGPPAADIRYTPVLTKQSALFNAWKLLCEISDTQGVPIRLTPAALIMAANVEAANGGGGKKQDKKKKVDSMLITLEPRQA